MAAVESRWTAENDSETRHPRKRTSAVHGETVEDRLDPRVGKWEQIRPMTTCRQFLGSAVFDGHLYAAGGRRSIASAGVLRMW
ncbi:hypothetical protein TELCIR_08276 [Teladorsagia circumcincta]|uniref:Kelch repeat protein n=1 Tax=Teladorsagia circumcincta TaxID=45464 RepID=A0A2G9UI29_TELCI|nr:hypothetical protein TELCIR_08276 [Teladorsagia circumcincta]